MPGNDRAPDSVSEAEPRAQKINRAAVITDSVSESNDNWLSGYSEEIKEAVRMNRRRRAASLRLAPLPSGKRDPWDVFTSDGPEAA
jgi:hypothetical protein